MPSIFKTSKGVSQKAISAQKVNLEQVANDPGPSKLSSSE